MCVALALQACILLLTGPAGCGKTATVRALAQELGIAVNEWINPLTEAYHSHRDDWETGKTWAACTYVPLLLGVGSGGGLCG